MVFLGVQAWQSRERQTRFVIDGQTVEIRRGADGHYHWSGRLAGREIEFLVDTGATGTAIPARLAEELGLQRVGTVRSNTAGGVVDGEIVLADLELEGGVSARQLRVAALPQLHKPLLGMDVLGRLAWRQEQGTLRIDLGGGR
jgi:aspartyl protease family protein